MKVITEENNIYLRWENKGFGLCEALIKNNKFLRFEFRENGSSSNGFYTHNLEYLIKLSEILNDLLKDLSDKDISKPPKLV